MKKINELENLEEYAIIPARLSETEQDEYFATCNKTCGICSLPHPCVFETHEDWLEWVNRYGYNPY